MLEFDKLPINTLVGADWDTFRKVTARQQIDKGFKGKYRLTTGVCRLLSALKPIEDSRFKKLADKPLEMDPLFILGHWRSGTTFVHNIFACDKHFGYTTTYQTVFPHLMLWGQPFFKKNMAFLMPDKRPTDNMELKVDLPQEEEFALSNMMPYTYYNFWFFPKRWMEYCDRYLLFNDITEEERRIFMDTFMRLVKVSLWNTNGTQYLSKNPPHTGRVKTLLEMFPNAKTVGLLYCSAEPNSVYQCDVIEGYLTEMGLETTRYAFTDTNDVTSVTQAAAAASDVIYIPTDNTAASNTEAIANVVIPEKVPVVAGEEGICKGCGVAALSISYYDLGYKTGEMAAEILADGADVSTMPVAFAPNVTKKYNAANCEALGITPPDGYEAIAD